MIIKDKHNILPCTSRKMILIAFSSTEAESLGFTIELQTFMALIQILKFVHLLPRKLSGHCDDLPANNNLNED